MQRAYRLKRTSLCNNAGLRKNTLQLHTALSNWWMARARLLVNHLIQADEGGLKDKMPAKCGHLGCDEVWVKRPIQALPGLHSFMQTILGS
ncbi:hypothetical protein COAQ111491_03995 [Comamonas aquatilis]